MGEEYKEGRKDEKSGVSPHRTKSPPSGVLTGDAIGGRMIGLRGRTSFASKNKRMRRRNAVSETINCDRDETKF